MNTPLRLTVLFLVTAPLAAWPAAAADPPVRKTGWTTSKVIGTPEPPSPFLVAPSYPKLKFKNPVELAVIPGTRRMLVAELGGRVVSFPDQQSVEKVDLVIDLKKHTPGLSNVYGVAFHPRFQKNRQCFISYIQGAQATGSKVVRYRMTDADPPTIDPASREVVFTWPSGGHNGAAIRFGPDGYLYISTGDGVGPNPPDPPNNGQDVSNLYSCMLRIDVDNTDPGRAYRVPKDNPLVSIKGARPEIWAYGFRNPWKISFDPKTGDLWLGDVGWELWEMIYRVVKGGNYGWSIVEGRQAVNSDFPRGPTPILPPTVDHPHSEAASITGGEVYYGTKLPALTGQYVYGDYETGKLWGFTWKDNKVTRHRELVDSSLRIICFGLDTSNELHFMAYTAGTIHRLVPNPQRGQPSRFPTRLSESGLFASVKNHRLAPGVIPYDVATEPWNDGATSQRAIAVPGNSQVTTNGKWGFPAGTVVLKTISLAMAPGRIETSRRLETQLMHYDGDAWRGYCYRWNDEQSDATLLESSGRDVALKLKHPDVVRRQQTWHFPSRVECVRCHNPWSGHVLSFNSAGLDVPAPSDSKSGSQLEALSNLGLFNPPLKGSANPALVNPYDDSRPVERRARSYLHANCGHCHRLHAGSAVLAYMHHDINLATTRMLDSKPTQGTFGIPEARIIAPGDPLRSVLFLRVSKLGRGRMPHIGSELVDAPGVSLLRDWISGLEGNNTPIARLSNAQRRSRLQPFVDANQLEHSRQPPSGDLLTRALASTSTALHLQSRLDAPGNAFTGTNRRMVIQQAVTHDDITIRDLFERFLPESQRVKRLGNVIRPAALLALKGDARTGRMLFQKSQAVQCRNCHRVANTGKALGPDLDGIGKKYSLRELLDQVLNPSRKIDPKFLTYVVETTAGRVHTGLLVSKTDKQVVLRDAKREERVIAAEDVEEIFAQRKSLMPELLLKDMTAQQVADLLAFLSSLKTPAAR